MRKTAILVGVAGSYNAFSLSLYNLKAFALADSHVQENWDIPVIQEPLVTDALYAETLERLTSQITQQKPDVVGFSCYLWNMKFFNELSDAIVKTLPHTRILYGGPEIAREYVEEGLYDNHPAHYCVSGEGEPPFLELLRMLSGGGGDISDINGLAYRNDLSSAFALNSPRIVSDSIAQFPSPYLEGIVDEEVLARDGVEANIETQRGCSLRCSYCIYHKDMGRPVYSVADRVLDEVAYALERGVRQIRFVDANFTSDLDHAKAIMRGLIDNKVELQLMFELIPGFIDQELADLFGEFTALHEWNEITTGIGVQTINRDVLKLVHRNIKKEKFELTFRLLRESKVFVKIDIIIGLPTEDVDSISRTLDYMMEQLRHSQGHLLCCHAMRGLPGTELMTIAEDYGMVFSSEIEQHLFVESPALPRMEALKSLRRAAIVFRLVNHIGWAEREFISGRRSDDVSLRELFFDTRERLNIGNIGLVDILIDKLMPVLAEKGSQFSDPEFPAAETWWWSKSYREVKKKHLVQILESL